MAKYQPRHAPKPRYKADRFISSLENNGLSSSDNLHVRRDRRNGNGHRVTNGGEHNLVAERLVKTELFEPDQPSVNGEDGNVGHRKTAGKHRSGTLPMLSGAALGGYGGSKIDLPGSIDVLGYSMPEVVETVGTTSVGALVVSALAGASFREIRETRDQPGKHRIMPAGQGVDALSIAPAFKSV